MARKKPKDEKCTDSHANPNSLLVQLHSLEAAKKYEELLQDADGKIIHQFHKATRQLLFAYWVNVAIHGLGFILAAILLYRGLSVIFDSNLQQSERDLGIPISLISLFLIVLILLRNPLKNFSHLVNDLARTQIIFFGFVRQINHIDTAYKTVLWNTETDAGKETNASLKKIQAVVEHSIDELMRSVEEIQ